MRSRFRQEKRREGGESFPDRTARPTGRLSAEFAQRSPGFSPFRLLSDLVVI